MRRVFRKRLLLASGFLVACLLRPGFADAQEAVRVTEEGIFLDFQDTDLRLVITALAEAGKLNVVYADLPARKVTLRTAQPVARDDIPALLESLAQSNGLLLIDEAGLLRIESLGPTAPGATGPATALGAEEEPRIFVYRLKHARAPRLAATLQSLFGGTPPRGAVERPRRPTLSQQLREQRLAPLEMDGEPEVTVEIGPVGEPSLPGQLSGEVQIVPDELTNSLLVRSNPADWEIIRQTVEALDLRPLQVLIEVLIAEVRREKSLEVGISGEITTTDGDRTITGTLVTQTVGDLVLEVMELGNPHIEATLNLLASSGRVRILSRPVILAQNNQEARILVGSERPFIQVFRSLPTDAAIRDQVVQFRDVGTSLTIVPTINIDGYVNLEVVQEVSTATSEVQFGAPVISTREAATHLFVKNGQTVVIGGLIENQEEKIRSGIPLLKDIPLFGFLFGTTRNSLNRNELFVFLTVHVVASDEDAERMREGVEGSVDLLEGELERERPLVPVKEIEPAGERQPARQAEPDEAGPAVVPAEPVVPDVPPGRPDPAPPVVPDDG